MILISIKTLFYCTEVDRVLDYFMIVGDAKFLRIDRLIENL